MNELLLNKDICNCRKSSYKKLINGLRAQFMRWKNKNFINDRKYKELHNILYYLKKSVKVGIMTEIINQFLSHGIYSVHTFQHYY